MVHYTDSFPGRTVAVNGTPHLYFGGTAYLGLQDHLHFQDIFIENTRRYGTNYGASRKSNVQFRVFHEAEALLAQLVGSEACLTLSSGYLAGQFLVQSLKSKTYRRFYAPNTHSALFSKKNKNYHSYADLRHDVEGHLGSGSAATPVLFLDSIDFSGQNYPHFSALGALPLEDMYLVVDDSHGIGVVGKDGEGVFARLRALGAKKLFMCCSLGKGFGIQGGAVFGHAADMDALRDSVFFGGASPASPAAMATLVQAQGLYAQRRDKLRQNLNLFLDQVPRPNPFVHMAGHPTFGFQNNRLAAGLLQRKIIVTHFNYPNDGAAPVSRIVLSAAHTDRDIAQLTSAIGAILGR
ncbi:aminotransferase class I/II-fold pyridoxal phosphate-dependent enzyme [Maribacter sp. 2307ULW6-5]|uniref:aminotransferase class I/II-fold pyridoxal phosphate-dependent enzyme n=1 Tax=Maribacter sp. 2307ULW6-5 TaxID=3386275 RepID=UPI0039BD35D5